MDLSTSEPSSIPPAGYRSESSRRRFTLTAGLVGFVFFIIQAAAPFFLIMAIAGTFLGFEAGRQDWPHLWDAVYWEGSLWYLQESVPRRMLPRLEATLQQLNPQRKDGPQVMASAFLEDPHLLAGSDRLWIISPEDVRHFREGRLTVVNVGWRLGDISAPFLLEGNPAVFEQRPAGVALTVFRDGQWVRGSHFRLPGPEEGIPAISRLRVVPCGGRYHLFMRMGDTLYHREGLPEGVAAEEEGWEPVVNSNSPVTAACLENKPTVFQERPELYRDVLASFQKGERGWAPRGDLALRSWRAEIGVVPTGRGSDIFVLSSGGRGGIGVSEVRDGRMEERGAHFPGETSLKTGQVLQLILLVAGGYLLLPIFLAFILSGMMSRWRVGQYREGSTAVPFASLWRRALAEVIDALVLGGPMLAGYLKMMGPFLFPSRGRIPSNPLPSILLMLAGLAWAVMGFVIFSFLDGKFGATPGKWVTGIRVRGTDLKPCGFVRGLVRNLLKVVDGFFNFIVGLMVTALSENWQRVGDMAARTVVVRTGAAGTLHADPPDQESSPPPCPDPGI